MKRDAQTLDVVQPGGRVRVTKFSVANPPQRLLELGLLPGTPVDVVRRAPLGDPIDIRVRGFHVSLRKREAACICVEVEP